MTDRRVPTESEQRTILADDRTLLAWFRTAFAAYAVAIGVGSLLPELAHSEAGAFRLLGAVFAVVGICAVALGATQYVLFRKAVDPRALARNMVRLTLTYAVVIAVLGLAITVVIGVGP